MYVIVTGPGSAYCRMVTTTIVVGFSHILIGAVNMAVLMFCINKNFADLHVALCTFGFHFFCVEAILFLNYANGLATPMRNRHRRYMHTFLQVCAMVCVITGTIMILVKRRNNDYSIHGLSGVVAATLAACSFLTSPLALYGKGKLKLVHFIMGLPTFVASSVSLCLAFVIEDFKNWAGAIVVNILIGFVSVYTIVITIKVMFKCIEFF